MADNSAVDGLRDMGLEGTGSSGTVNVATGPSTFSGTATLHVNGKTSAIGFELKVDDDGPLWDGSS